MKKLEEIINKENKKIERTIHASGLKTVAETFDEKKEITVTVFCACYNQEKYIEQCLDSILNQKVNFNVEIIVHDDASTDGSREIIKKYEKKYPKIIKPIYQSINQYSIDSNRVKNAMRSVARGKFYARCECDDFWTSPYKLFLQVEFLETHTEYSGCMHNTFWYDHKTKNIKRFFKNIDDEMLMAYINSCHTSSIVGRQDAENASIECLSKNVYGVGDYLTKLRLVTLGKIKIFKYSMSAYRFKSSPSSWTSNQKDLNKTKLRTQKFIDILNNLLKISNGKKREECIKFAICREEVFMCELNEDYKEIFKNKNYRKTLVSFSFYDRIRLFVHAYLPFVFKIIKGKIN